MKERPILFSPSMVKAILKGSKSQTRRVIRDRGWAAEGWSTDDDKWPMVSDGYAGGKWHRLRCPLGEPGDRLWVKESIARGETERLPDGDTFVESFYVADGARTKADSWPWKLKVLPSMFMPWGLRRITLEITEVRVERLQDISDEDAQAEGCEPEADPEEYEYDQWSMTEDDRACGYFTSRNITQGFVNLWDSINSKRAPWSSNPWVWVVSFRRVEQAKAGA